MVLSCNDLQSLSHCKGEMMRNRNFILVVLLLTLLVLGGMPMIAMAIEDPAAPPAPPGFASSGDLLKAFTSGKIELISISSDIPKGISAETNIVYGKGGERDLQLDLYRPKDAKQPRPLIIFIHGGGWKGGQRTDMSFYCLRFAEKGYITATISYRFSQDAPFPAAVQDTKCAIRFLRANASKYGIDPEKIAVSGNSAGGHLSMMAGYSSDVPELEGNGGNEGVSSRIQVVGNFYGPVDLTTEFARTQGVVKDFLGDKTWEEDPDIYKKASPITYLTKDDPPTMIFHGTIDDIVPIDQADELAAKLKDLGIPYLYERIEGWPHTMDLARAINDRCSYFMEKFFKEHLPLPKE